MNTLEKLVCGVGEGLIKVSVEPRCWIGSVYEPSLSNEIIQEIVNCNTEKA